MSFNFSRVIFLIFLGLVLFQSCSAQSLVKLVKHGADQEKFCAEFERCMTKLATSANGVLSSIKMVELGPDTADIPVHHFVCARRSNCRHQQREFCKPHMGSNGTIEMKFLCQISWMSGSDETDKSDPATQLEIEEDQNKACSNYEKCLETPIEAFKVLQNLPLGAALGHVTKISKRLLCNARANCLREMKILCDEERAVNKGQKLGKIVSVVCSLVTYAEIEALNPAGPRSLGGGASLSQQVLSDVCKSTKDGVCSLV